jgi:cyanophycin synthetase
LESINYLSHERVVVVDMTLPEAFYSRQLNGLVYRVLVQIPHPPQDKEWVADLGRRLECATSWSDSVAAVAQYLQRIVVRFDGNLFLGLPCKTGQQLFGLECLEFELGEACANAALQFFEQANDTGVILSDSILERLSDIHEEFSLGSVTGPIVSAAKRVGVPTRRLDGGSLIQLGHGKFQRRIRRSCTTNTGYIAELVSVNKLLVKSLWREIGIPVAIGKEVTDVESAVAALTELGAPVVVKPIDADYGNGISVGLKTAEEVQIAYAKATLEDGGVMVEKHMHGDSYRLLVLHGEVISAVRRLPARICGDGKHSIAELILLANSDPNRGTDRRWPLYRINPENVDLKWLRQQGWEMTSVPAASEFVTLRSDIDHTEGGTNHEVLQQVHPQTLRQACLAAECIGLDLAGLDLMAKDIGIPLLEQGGGFLEINAEPGIGLHLPPMCDHPRPVDEAIIGSLFGKEIPRRIPVVLILADDHRDPSVRKWLQSPNHSPESIAISCDEWSKVGDIRLNPRSNNLSDRLRATLLHPKTTIAIAVAKLEEAVRLGVGVDKLDTVVLTSANGATLTLEESSLCQTRQFLLNAVRRSDRFYAPRNNHVLDLVANETSPLVEYLAYP